MLKLWYSETCLAMNENGKLIDHKWSEECPGPKWKPVQTIFADELPEMIEEDLEYWFERSLVVYGRRMGPVIQVK